jgi:hypothetical protein
MVNQIFQALAGPLGLQSELAVAVLVLSLTI